MGATRPSPAKPQSRGGIFSILSGETPGTAPGEPDPSKLKPSPSIILWCVTLGRYHSPSVASEIQKQYIINGELLEGLSRNLLKLLAPLPGQAVYLPVKQQSA